MPTILAICDPPYGLEICNGKIGRNNGKNYIATRYDRIETLGQRTAIR